MSISLTTYADKMVGLSYCSSYVNLLVKLNTRRSKVGESPDYIDKGKSAKTVWFNRFNP